MPSSRGRATSWTVDAPSLPHRRQDQGAKGPGDPLRRTTLKGTGGGSVTDEVGALYGGVASALREMKRACIPQAVEEVAETKRLAINGDAKRS